MLCNELVYIEECNTLVRGGRAVQKVGGGGGRRLGMEMNGGVRCV